MLRRVVIGILLGASLLSSGLSYALPVISLEPANQNINAQGNVFVNIKISGLQADDPSQVLGAFDLTVLYNPGVLSFLSVAPAGFGPGLGDVSLGEAISFLDTSVAGQVNLGEVSLLETDPTTCLFCIGPYLSDLQSDSFTLATIGFYAFNPNFAGHTQLGITNVLLSDGFGNLIQVGGISGADIKVPEPGAFAMFGLGLCLMLIVAWQRNGMMARNKLF